ncbi:hypothetical protein A0H81_10606 [Grifola frondosa]|uniref:Uncharacterized protein n=1 Tax=Grifola frondosa TaxID=5627 RepID=A0A1C7LXD6_GRIFR|nr:hypothetical protein A0H81_10606 [Grifola frondosa]
MLTARQLIFIFSTHVFDVGDLAVLDDVPAVDGQEITAPNALLLGSKLVHNLRCSSSMWESTTTLVTAYNTSLAVIEQLRTRLAAYTSQNSREWCGIAVNIDKMKYQNAVHFVAMEHRPNWQDWGGRWARRTEFMRHLKTMLEDLNVRYTMRVKPVLLPRPAAHSAPNVELRR